MYIGHKLEEKAIDMSDWNQMNVADRATELLAKISEPRRRQILENFIEHATAECVGDYERLMASCSKKSQRYEVYGRDIDRSTLPQSYQALEKHYYKLIEQNLYNIHTELESLSVGEDSLVLDLVDYVSFLSLTKMVLAAANMPTAVAQRPKSTLPKYLPSRFLNHFTTTLSLTKLPDIAAKLAASLSDCPVLTRD
jgi:hypothetical protein